MKIATESFRVPEGKAVDLAAWPTRAEPFYESTQAYEAALSQHVAALTERQRLLYAHDRYSLLLIFQGMDAGGKDGVIRHVMSGVNPQGCQVFRFEIPSAAELDHDFLWRTTLCLPERGRIGIFNRSYYEEVLVARVHPEILRAQKLPEESLKAPKVWKHRYDSICDFERHLHRNGTRVVKFFLHLSPEEQRIRFLARLDEPDKNWKFGLADIEERKYWPQYMQAYADCLGATSTDHAPWYVVPADDKQNARLIVSQVLADAIDSLKMIFPPSAIEPGELESIRKALRADAPK